MNDFSAAELLHALDPASLLPAHLHQWAPLLVEALDHFLAALPEARQEAIVAAQFALPFDSTPHARLVALLEQCPTLHKLGQVVARQPRLDAELRSHLQELESAPSALPLASLQDAIDDACGNTPPPALQLAPQALAAGSVAVVWPFTWLAADGTRQHGVFKVLKPGIEQTLAEDLAALPSLADFVERRSAELGLPPLDTRSPLESVQSLLREEIRLDIEQQHLATAVELYAGMADIAIPQVLPWCSARVTAMTQVFGAPLDVAAPTLPVAQRQRLADALVAALIARPFWSRAEVAHFHGDLHGGNLLYTADDRIAVLDWSLAAPLRKPLREALTACATATLALDGHALTNAIARLCTRPPDASVLAREVDVVLDRLVVRREIPGFGWLMELFDVLALSGVSFDDQLLLLRKTWLSLAGVIHSLDPGAHRADTALIGTGLQALCTEWPWRWLSPPASRAFATHVSNADLYGVFANLSLAGWRYWTRSLGLTLRP